jgi:hypothetical protein
MNRLSVNQITKDEAENVDNMYHQGRKSRALREKERFKGIAELLVEYGTTGNSLTCLVLHCRYCGGTQCVDDSKNRFEKGDCFSCHNLEGVKVLGLQKYGERPEVNIVHTDTPCEAAFDDQLRYRSRRAKTWFAETRETSPQKMEIDLHCVGGLLGWSLRMARDP